MSSQKLDPLVCHNVACSMNIRLKNRKLAVRHTDKIQANVFILTEKKPDLLTQAEETVKLGA